MATILSEFRSLIISCKSKFPQNVQRITSIPKVDETIVDVIKSKQNRFFELFERRSCKVQVDFKDEISREKSFFGCLIGFFTDLNKIVRILTCLRLLETGDGLLFLIIGVIIGRVRGVKICPILCDVIYGRPLNTLNDVATKN